MNFSKRAKPLNERDKLRRDLEALFVDWKSDWDGDLPKKWKKAEDMVILPCNCFLLEHWTLNEKFLPTVAQAFRAKRLAQEHKVKSDQFRTPSLKLLYGNSPILTVNNNGIKYCYDITKCMFSWGNITEKLRIADFDCSQETVVDLFAGIGYFTLVYLVHSKAKHVIACEWNPASVEALRNNLKINECEQRCQVLPGDNRETCPENVADRVNLGLIPSSELSWRTACYALKKHSGGVLHIHGNVDIHSNVKDKGIKKEWTDWSEYARNEILRILNERTLDDKIKWTVTTDHIEYVKAYGPRVDHLVLDLKCLPNKI
ncbi:tRNA wybutosine-synthesizing 2 -like protein [Brachionus plicatilis]|uniref:tRNA(Phe) (4-demethylwyosine(37)-C(7)) aminocarboxypropyltransferase n=1 Tax=Brachionus plicatilis TaxID=10195 RepID=A0A3M7QPV9_BRAPC|nr:tRNA wybutosine-synthesizing 2 -like protein [Brachionus plicatilis]